MPPSPAPFPALLLLLALSSLLLAGTCLCDRANESSLQTPDALSNGTAEILPKDGGEVVGEVAEDAGPVEVESSAGGGVSTGETSANSSSTSTTSSTISSTTVSTTTTTTPSTTTSREMARRRAAVAGSGSSAQHHHQAEPRRRAEVSAQAARGRRRHTEDYAARGAQHAQQTWVRPPHVGTQPHTMSQSLYDHFSPLDPELPSGDILPFLQFGMKLPPVVGNGATKSKPRQRPTTATTSAPRTTTPFPGASTNALVEEETGNEMRPQDGPEDPSNGATRSRNDQPHSTRQASKLKAAILLQMMVNNVRRKKLALGANTTGPRKEEKPGGVVALKEAEVRSKEEDDDGEILVTGGVRDRVARPEGRRANAAKEIKDNPEGIGAKDITPVDSQAPPSVPNTKAVPEEEKLSSGDKAQEVSRDEKDEEKKVGVGAEAATEEADENDDKSSVEEPKTESVEEVGKPAVTEEEVVEEDWEKGKEDSSEEENGSEDEEDDDESVEKEEEEIENESGEDEDSSLLPYPKRRVVLVSRRRKKNNEYEAVPLSVASSPSPRLSEEPVLSDSPPRSEMSRLKSIPPVTAQEDKKPEDMEWKMAPPVLQTRAPEIVHEVKHNVTTSTTEKPIPSTTPSLSAQSTTSPKPPHVVPNVVLTTSARTPMNDSVSTTNVPFSTSTAKTTVGSTTKPTTKQTASTTTTTTTTPSPLLSLLMNSTTTIKPVPSSIHPPVTRQPYRPFVEHSSRQPPVAQPGHPQIHPSLLAPVPHVLSPFYKSTTTTTTTTQKPNQEKPSTAIPPSTVGKVPQREVPVKIEIDARDWVAVPPPNTSPPPPPRINTPKPVTPEPSPPKPHPNGVEKGWQRPHPNPPSQPHHFQPNIPIEHHFNSQWRPSVPQQPHANVPHSSPRPQPTTVSSTTAGREVLSVVTSVSVESSPAIKPTPSSASFMPPTSPSSESVSLESGSHESHVTEGPSASDFPQLVNVFVDGPGNTLEADSEQDEEPEVLAEAGMGPTATYVLLSLAIVPGVVAIASAARCLLVHRKKNLYESETSSEVSCMGGRTLKSCSRGDHIPHTMTAEETGTIRQGSDVFRAITRLPRVAHLGWDHERRRRQGGGKGGRSGGGVLEAEEGPAREEQEGIDNPLKEALEETSSWEFPRSKLRLQTLLGQGNFGQVWKAEADGICDGEGSTRLVAVKLVKAKEGDDGDEEVTVAEDPLAQQCTLAQPSAANSSRRPGEAMTVMEQCRRKRREEFMAELGIMQLLSPPHPNVVTLLGCCTTTEPPLLIMEYVMFGKLLTYLRDHRSKRQYCNASDDPEILTSRDLLVFAYCVVKGMEYLVSKGVVHRDLAARNILVDHNKTCKIADFGMSRSVRETGGQIYEERQKQGALPVRWMAPESLFRGIFTHKSDVWSFGVLLWEIITLGSTPYPGIGARDVMRRVRDGRRLERPSHVRPEIFRVAARCWHRDSTLRPTFSRLRADLGPLLASAATGITLGSGTGDSEMCLVPNRGNRRWRPPGPQIDLSRFEDDSY